MKKLVAVAATVFAVAAVFTGGIAAGNGGKVIDEGFACGIVDGNGNVFITTNSQRILYQTKVVLRCSGDGAAAVNGPIYFKGLNCNIGGGYGATTDSIDKVGNSGNSQLTCTLALDAPTSAASGGSGIG